MHWQFSVSLSHLEAPDTFHSLCIISAVIQVCFPFVVSRDCHVVFNSCLGSFDWTVVRIICRESSVLLLSFFFSIAIITQSSLSCRPCTLCIKHKKWQHCYDDVFFFLFCELHNDHFGSWLQWFSSPLHSLFVQEQICNLAGVYNKYGCGLRAHSCDCQCITPKYLCHLFCITFFLYSFNGTLYSYIFP